jgi:hypothetical protein
MPAARLIVLLLATVLLAACVPAAAPTPQVVEKVVKETVFVEATAAPAAADAMAAMKGKKMACCVPWPSEHSRPDHLGL